MFDYVYYFKNFDGDEELKNSMRSVQKNAGDFGRFILMGEIPSWFKESEKAIALPLEQPTLPRGEVSWWYLRKLLALNVVKEYKFILMNDDFVLMKYQDEIPQHYRAEQDYMIYAFPNKVYHRKTMNALAMLKKLKIDTEMKFNLHVPMPLKKNLVELCLYYQDMYHFRDIDFRTFYGNIENKLNPVENLYAINDVKTMMTVKPKEVAFNSTYLSTSKRTFNKYKEDFLSLFPEKSIAEK